MIGSQSNDRLPIFCFTPTQKLLRVYQPYSTTTMYSSPAAL